MDTPGSDGTVGAPGHATQSATREVDRLRDALRAERERFNSIIQRNVDGILVTNEDGIVLFANPAAAHLFGRDDLVGEPFGFPLLSGEETELDVIRPCGVTALVEARTIPSTWNGVPASIVMLRDITEQRQQEERSRQLAREQAARRAAEQAQDRLRKLADESAELAAENHRLYEEARAANRAKTDFLAVMSHELRTPLNAVFGFADLLETGTGGALNPTQAQYTERIQISARHLLSLVNDILDYAKMEAGRENLVFEDVDFASVLRDAAGPIEPEARARNLELVVDAPDERVTWSTDPSRIRQVLFNLLTNAIKFTDEGEVRIEGRVTDDEFMIVIQDSGIGIAAEHHGTVFEPFWQVAPATTREKGGTGLGLAIAQRLTQLLGGTISLTSAAGQGSRFTLRFPRTPTD